MIFGVSVTVKKEKRDEKKAKKQYIGGVRRRKQKGVAIYTGTTENLYWVPCSFEKDKIKKYSIIILG